MNPYKDFDNYLKEFPSADGYFGEYGGAYLSEELKPAFEEANRQILQGYENEAADCHSPVPWC